MTIYKVTIFNLAIHREINQEYQLEINFTSAVRAFDPGCF